MKSRLSLFILWLICQNVQAQLFTRHTVQLTHDNDRIVDVDNDGIADLIGILEGETVMFHNEGMGNMGEPQLLNLPDKNSLFLDLDNDGDLDGVSSNVWYENNGANSFNIAHNLPEAAMKPFDQDKDGDIDFIALTFDFIENTVNIRCYDNDGNANFSLLYNTVTSLDLNDTSQELINDFWTVSNFGPIKFGNFDIDAHLDFIMLYANYDEENFGVKTDSIFVKIFTGDGAGNFGIVQDTLLFANENAYNSIAYFISSKIQVADMDFNGYDDIIAVINYEYFESTQYFLLEFRKQEGGFHVNTLHGEGYDDKSGFMGQLSLNVCNINNDNFPDLMKLSYNFNHIQYHDGMLNNNGTGYTYLPGTINGNNFNNIAFLPLDSIGLNDWVATAYSWRNNDNDSIVGTWHNFKKPMFGASSDVDNDGDSDFILSDRSRLYLKRQMGLDVYNDETIYEVNSGDAKIYLTDLNNDGIMDIAFWHDNIAHGFYNDGTGSFSHAYEFELSTSQFKLVDWDNNSITDWLYILSNDPPNGPNYPYNDSLYICLLQTDNTFSKLTLCHLRSPYNYSDVEQDGDLDIIYSEFSALYLLRQTSPNTFSAPETLFPDEASFITGDLNNDAKPDLIFNDGTQTYIAFNTDGYFNNIQSYNTGNSIIKGIEDLNNDGLKDIILSNNWLKNLDFETFEQNPQYNASFNALLLGDIDSDSDLDILTSKNGNYEVRQNNGAGVFDSDGIIITPADENYLAFTSFEDIDNDGDMDLLATKLGSCYFFENLGITDGIEDLLYTNITDGLTIVPNPACSTFSVSLPDNTGIMPTKLDLYSMSGECVLTKELHPNQRLVLIPIKDLKSGMYMVVLPELQNYKVKLLIQH